MSSSGRLALRPTLFTIPPNDPAPVASVGTWTALSVSSTYNTSCAVNDSITVRGDVVPGSWSAEAVLGGQNNCGIVKVEYSPDEGTTWTTAGVQDCYTTGATALVVPFSFTTTHGTLLVRWTVTGKNASSNAQFAILGPVNLARTSK